MPKSTMLKFSRCQIRVSSILEISLTAAFQLLIRTNWASSSSGLCTSRPCLLLLEDAIEAVEREARNGRDRAQSEHVEQDCADKHAENG